ncbi:hypothetical protein FB451DRAFT_1397269 [Mycena latifolia]|nr:hypothetical protein FB451DRAFT_1397269 [Mycena latifolia]
MSSPYEIVKPLAQRTVPMQVLALGFPRTGTASLKLALETLGYVRTSHGFAVHSSSPTVIDMWITAIRAKFYGEGTPYGRTEWDLLLGDCQAVSDVPHILFAEELITAYPDAKVVLTNRSPETEGLKPTFQVRLNHWLDPENAGKSEHLFQLIYAALFATEHVTEGIAKARFKAHYNEVRRLVPKDRLFEFEVKDGWAPLTKFLGKEMPAAPFPSANNTEQFQKRIATKRGAVSWAWALKMVGSLLVVGVPATMAILILR